MPDTHSPPSPTVSTAPIAGFCHPDWESMRAHFEVNFAKHGELGASLCIMKRGEIIVDLWGGYQAPDKKQAWQKDTVSIVFSCTKAATALCAHILIDRGLLDLDAPIAQYWPEFAQQNKGHITVRMALAHQAGVSAFHEPIKKDGFYDFPYMAERIAAEPTFWDTTQNPPQNGYHMISFGWLIGELVRRVYGTSLGEFFRSEIARPLGLDMHIGLDEDTFAQVSERIAPMIAHVMQADDPQTDYITTLMNDPQSLQYLALFNTGGYYFDDPKAWRAQIGGVGGIGNARSLARMMAPLSYAHDKSYLSQDRIEDMRQPLSESKCDETLLIPTRFGQGFMLSMDNRHNQPSGNSAVFGANAFGHVGMGGSLVLCEREHEISFAYTMNKMGAGILLNERAQSLLTACYNLLGAPL